jgi:hypothetical protein
VVLVSVIVGRPFDILGLKPCPQGSSRAGFPKQKCRPRARMERVVPDSGIAVRSNPDLAAFVSAAF